MSASGSCGSSKIVSTGCTIVPVAAASRSFPPEVAMHVVKIACERPDDAGRSLSQWDCTEIARQLVRDAAFAAQVRGICELYTRPLRPDEVVLCVDEMTSLQPRPRKAETLATRKD